jgi:ElaB/YqjD/DUF883 family membrane-anchored ribosome-binding protein
MFKAKGLPSVKAAGDEPPKSAFDKLLTTTPVVMTVVATLLAGLSSGEMTKAQYFRALAAQHQSKVGDRWAFFQAKRARGSGHDLTVKLLRAVAEPGDIDLVSLQASADHLAAQLQRGQTQAEELVKQTAQAQVGPSKGALRSAAEKLLTLTRDQLTKADTLKQRFAAVLADPDVRRAVACLGAGEPPEFLRPKADVTAEDPQIRTALDEIAERRTEQETEPVIVPIKEEALRAAIRDTEAHAKAFDTAGQPVGKGLDRVDQLLHEEARLARAFHRGALEFWAAVGQTAAEARALADVRRRATALAEEALVLKSAVNELSTNFTAAQLRYNGWRYEQEARDNRRAAGLYEIEVRKNGWSADRHRRRSAYFFYGMLAAQAGVTIASLALAVRLRSVLWGLASAAGVAAVAIAGYVYFYV